MGSSGQTGRHLMHQILGLLAGCWALLEILGLALARPAPYGAPSLIVIYSAPGHFERRLAIRRTWCSAASLLPSGSRCVFLLGRAGPEARLAQENQLFADLVLDDTFVDTYQHLSFKLLSMLAGSQRWRRPGELCLVKADDDDYIDTRALFDICRRARANEVVGKVALFHRQRRGESFRGRCYNQSAGNTYFEYFPLGPVIVLPFAAVEALDLVMLRCPADFGSEDDVMLAYLAKLAGLRLLAMQHLFTGTRHTSNASSCWLRRGASIAISDLSAGDMARIHREMAFTVYWPCLPRHTLLGLYKSAETRWLNWHLQGPLAKDIFPRFRNVAARCAPDGSYAWTLILLTIKKTQRGSLALKAAPSLPFLLLPEDVMWGL
eukprot:g23093.t1